MPETATLQNRQAIGKAAEDDALAYLLKQGLALVKRNFRCKTGEIDLIMREGDTLVFVEVRKRNAHHFGSAAESITQPKQHRLTRAAQFFLQGLEKIPPCRFDAVTFNSGKMTWLKNIIDGM